MSSIDDALKAIAALPPKQREAAIADLRARQLHAATTLVIGLTPEELAAAAAKLPNEPPAAKSARDMSEGEYSAAKAEVDRTDRSKRLKASDARDMARATAKHSSKKA
jgi:hypothetical protein